MKGRRKEGERDSKEQEVGVSMRTGSENNLQLFMVFIPGKCVF